MEPISRELEPLRRVLTSLVHQLHPDARVGFSDKGFLGDVVYAEIELEPRDKSRGSAAVRERKPPYGQASSRPVNLLISVEACRQLVDDPSRFVATMELALREASREPSAVSFWLITMTDIKQVKVGSGIVGLSDQYVEDLADTVAIEEGRREFAAWRAMHASRGDHRDRA